MNVAKSPAYRRLPGRGRRGIVPLVWMARSRLWLSADHLLNVDSLYYREEYKRFYLRDIQAIISRRTARRAGWNVVLGGLLGLYAYLGLGPLAEFIVVQIVCAIIAGLLFVGIVINSLYGPTCACYVRTAVQTERLFALNRLRTLRRFLTIVQPLIETAQE